MYDAILIVSFGGPEKREEDVMPFLENVTRGRNIPRDGCSKSAEHYYHFGGKSPINDQCRELIVALSSGTRGIRDRSADLLGQPELASAPGRYASPDAERRREHALAFMTSAYSSYSGCRQYRENIAAAQAEVGEGAPKVDKLRVFYNHPGFIEASVDRVREALSAVFTKRTPRDWVRFYGS